MENTKSLYLVFKYKVLYAFYVALVRLDLKVQRKLDQMVRDVENDGS